MIKNFFKIAIRNIQKHKAYSVINIAGLAIGITCCVLILIYVQYELSFDKYHENAKNIYRVHMKQPSNLYQGSDLFNLTPAPLAKAMKNDFPEVIYSSRVITRKPVLVYKEKIFDDDIICFADPEFLKIFSFPLITGNPDKVINAPYSMVITEKAAKKYFGNENPMGKLINYNKTIDYTITGIIEDVPDNSHFTFDFIASFSTFEDIYGEEEMKRWNRNPFQTYFLLQDGFNPEELEEKLPEFTLKYKHKSDEHKSDEQFHIMPITKIHLYSNMNFEIEINSKIKLIYIFSSIAFFIMLIACFNYMNLATARSANRSREVGLRKVVGANRYSLLKQFLSESIILSFVSLLFAIVFVILLLPWFSNFIDRELGDFILNKSIIFSIIVLTIFIGFISGSYPALYLSSFQPLQILKGSINSKNGNTRKGVIFRNSLIVIQFIITILLIISSITIFSQLNYIRNKDLGFNSEHIVTVPLNSETQKKIEPLKNALLRHSQITDLTVSDNLPITIKPNSRGWWEGKNNEVDQSFLISRLVVDANYFNFYGIELVDGKGFSEKLSGDFKNAFIINETAVKKIGWDSPIGKGFSFDSNNKNGTVLGVIKDFHYYPLKLAIEPLGIKLIQANGREWEKRYLSIKINSSDMSNTLGFIEEKFKEFAPTYPYEYSFLDDRIEQMYRSEKQLGKIFNYFTLIAIFLACLGLFGMASFLVEQRTKEIGIRKVNGASMSSIIIMLFKKFTGWVIISNIIAWPLAWYVMDAWLQNFTFRINLSWWIFVFAGFMAFLIALLTVSFQTVKAANKNPVDSLRHE